MLVCEGSAGSSSICSVIVMSSEVATAASDERLLNAIKIAGRIRHSAI